MNIPMEGVYLGIFHDSKGNAKRRGIKFEIDIDYFMDICANQHGYCAVTSIPFDFSSRAREQKRPFYPSLDRIDSGIGYVKGNVRLVLTMANYAMNEWGDGPFLEMVNQMIKTRDDERVERVIEEIKCALINIEDNKKESNTTMHEQDNTPLCRKDASKYLQSIGIQISHSTLGKLASIGGGPEYRKAFGRAYYTKQKLDEWVEDKTSKPFKSTSGYYKS